MTGGLSVAAITVVSDTDVSATLHYGRDSSVVCKPTTKQLYMTIETCRK